MAESSSVLRSPAGALLARAAVLGHPIGHSLSPALHSAAYAELGLSEWSYQAIDCTEADFPAFFAGLGSEWRGLSLTMPLKRVVMPLLDEVSPLALAVGAVNTVTWDGARRAVGDNTDVRGIVEALRSVGVGSVGVGSVGVGTVGVGSMAVGDSVGVGSSAVADGSPVAGGSVGAVGSACILGGGATACSAVAALAHLGCKQVLLQVRSAARAGEVLAVAERFGVQATIGPLEDLEPALSADVLINTLPGSAATDWAERLRGSTSRNLSGVLLDVNYHPWPTPMASAWTAAGGIAVGGFEMLLHQAVAQVTLMTGLEPPIEPMRVAGEKALT